MRPLLSSQTTPGAAVIAKDGIPYVGVALGIGGLAWYVSLWPLAGVALLLLGWSLIFFRLPARKVPAQPLGVLAPVDGVLVAVEWAQDPYLQRPAHCFRIENRWFDSHQFRAATEGKMVQHWPGADGRQFACHLQTDEDDSVVVVIQVRSRRLGARLGFQQGERVGQGQACGYCPRSMQVAVYLPDNARLSAQPGQVVRAGQDVLGSFVHTQK